jgi:hypothetical protein
MRAQAERWGAELRSEDVEFVDVRNRPFTVRSSDSEVLFSVPKSVVHFCSIACTKTMTNDNFLVNEGDTCCGL